MGMKHHLASYNLGDRKLKADERIVVGTSPEVLEVHRVSKHLGVHKYQGDKIITHRVWLDGEYLPTFMTKKCFDSQEFFRYKDRYKGPHNEIVYGEGLKGKTIYIVHTQKVGFTPQDLMKRVELIANTAKYNGAEAVVLLSYTLDFAAQERGVHEEYNLRMKTEKDKLKFDGQAPSLQLLFQQYLTSGVDTIITPHIHAPETAQTLCKLVNEEFAPMYERARQINSTRRYQLNLVEIDLAPVVGTFLADFGASHLDFDLSDKGKNMLFLAPDVGATPYVKRIRQSSGLENSALAVMNKKRAADGVGIEQLELVDTINLTERGIEGMYAFSADDSIRSGTTMENNVKAIRSSSAEGLRDPKLQGNLKRVAVFATRSNLDNSAIRVLQSSYIDDIVVTNADPRAREGMRILTKTQLMWINFVIGAAAIAVESGKHPNDILTPDYIRTKKLIRMELPHGHRLADDTEESDII